MGIDPGQTVFRGQVISFLSLIHFQIEAVRARDQRSLQGDSSG